MPGLLVSKAGVAPAMRMGGRRIAALEFCDLAVGRVLTCWLMWLYEPLLSVF